MSVNLSRTFTTSTKSAGLPPRTIRFIGSNESVDRDGDTIALDGWIVDKYMRNPVVLYGHDPSDMPVGKTVNLTLDTRARALMFDIQFPTIEEMSSNPATPSAHALKVDAIYNMAKAGILNAVSVGFRGMDYEPTATGRNYKKQELMEISIVPIPANPDAVAVLRGAGVSELTIKELKMNPVEKAGARLSKSTIERIGRIREKCNDLMKDLDELEKGEPNVGEEENPAVVGSDGKPSDPAPDSSGKSAVAPEYIFELVEKTSQAEKE